MDTDIVIRSETNVCREGYNEICKNTTDRIRETLHSFKWVYIMCVSYKDLSKSAYKNEQTRSFKDECLQVICALRNSNSGCLVIHTYDKPDMAWSLDGFDQLVNEDCSMMVEDDTLYTENYERRWFVEEGSEDRLPYLVITVEPSSSISTYDFKTKVALDGAMVRPKARQIATYLCGVEQKRYIEAEPEPEEEFEEGKATYIYESRNVQNKQLSNTDTVIKIVKQFVKLKLLEYLTAFSKLPQGGSFYYGIKEEKGTSSTKTGQNIIEGIDLTKQHKTDLEKKLREIIVEKTNWYEKGNNGEYNRLESDCILKYIDIKFHHTKKRQGQDTDMSQCKRKYVIQVSVKRIFNGMVFCTNNICQDQPNGPIPLSFMFSQKQNKMVPIDTIYWLTLIEKAATLLER